MFKHITDEICSGETFAAPTHLLSSAAGNANSTGKDKTWIVDVDEQYVPFKGCIREMVTQCEPFQPLDDIMEIQTKHGFHLITKPFNLMKMNVL